MSSHDHKPAVSGPLTGATELAIAGLEAGQAMHDFGSNAARQARTHAAGELSSLYDWARDAGTDALSPLVDLSPLAAPSESNPVRRSRPAPSLLRTRYRSGSQPPGVRMPGT